MMRCPLLCGKNKEKKERWQTETKKKREEEDKKAISWATDKKED